MSKGAKTTLFVVFAIIAVVGGGLVYVATQLDSIVAGIIEEQGSAATQTPVRVGGVSIDLRGATGAISELTVANPDGFSGNAIEMEDFSLALDASSLTEDTIVIRDVTVRGARLDILQQGSRNNLRELMRNLEQLQGDDPAADDEAGKRVIIERFTLDGARASVSLPDLDERREVTLPAIVVRDIGRASGGATGAQVAAQILRPVVDRALSSAATQTLKDRAGEKLEEVTDGLLRGLGNALGGESEEQQ